MNNIKLDKIIKRVEQPARYSGGELNCVYKENPEIRYLFAFPDVYEVGMSHLGMKILYHQINERPDTWCERVFAPWIDMEEEMIKEGCELFALESRDSIKDFDIIGFTLQYELSYTNLLNMLKLGNIPLYSKDRDDSFPIIMAGGPCGVNPEPIADFIDLFVIGDGEDIIEVLLDGYKKYPHKEDYLKWASSIDGVYVPGLYDTYTKNGVVYTDIDKPVKRQIVLDLESAYVPTKMIVPYMQIVHDRIMMEIFRGCTRGCRFCQAGIIYRPVRERSIDNIIAKVQETVDNTGYEEVSLSSLSTADYSRIGDLVEGMMKNIACQGVSVSLPSLRLDSFAGEYAKDIQKTKKTSLTFAPEAGTQRLRDVVNKNISNEDLMKAMREAFEAGYDRVKLYFMIGLPTETEEDLRGIGKLAHQIRDLWSTVKREQGYKGGRGPTITVSASCFVPKPHTPFQWVPQCSIEEFYEKIDILKGVLKNRSIKFNYHAPHTSHLEGVFAKGDRSLSKVLEYAVENGCRFDGWHEIFDNEKWQDAFKRAGVTSQSYAQREFKKEDKLPWDIIDVGITKKYLYKEYEKAQKAILTPDCRKRCTGCGLNQFIEGGCPQCE